MPQAAKEIVIERPIGEVFTFLSNAENDRLWRTGVSEIRHVAGSGLGARYEQSVKGPGGRQIGANIEITEFEPDRLIGFQTTSGPVRPQGRCVLTAIDGCAQVRFELEARLSGLRKLMGSMVQRSMNNEVGQLANLKQLLETR